ncbi:MAG: tRNA preQ1(34) S-adenosylmethionine ribosyltransferase-isomerase QueA [Syntrophomonadaceae bacterium]|jgi:S-adenosylmethionine:tRNA ribosyltransferase-isomerase|nr:tRNA preQ1(34) S-adenosylmethionine ribosyltransferase-isomerase QueA [Syntrophomonadaceae bacterium]
MDLHDIKTYNFYLPAELIAQHPQSPRDHARLLVVDRKTGEFRDLIFRQIDELLSEQDVLVLNETRVMAARLEGRKPATGGQVEVLLLRPQGKDWVCLGRPAKRMRPGTIIEFGDGRMRGKVLADLEFAGGKLIRFEGYEDFFQTINEVGRVPLPPYINRPATGKDADDYQTVYAREYGSAAAPTAGLHFTPQLLNRIEKGGTEIIRLVLHVGLGTFRPVEAADIRDHVMHKEFYELKEEAAGKLNRARRQGKRIVAVGTTSVRVLESTHKAGEGFNAGAGETGLYIYPGYSFAAVDALVTNFHLPKSSLLMLVSAFGGIELIKKAYQHAIANNYRFFSYGDAMFII